MNHKICMWGGGKTQLKRVFQAFTLAEVLITLVIIGVIAAITVPIVNNTVQDKQFNAKAKKVYSTINNALRKAQADEGSIGEYTSIFNPEQSNDETMEKFAKYLNVLAVCKTGDETGNCKEIQHVTTGTNVNVYWKNKSRIVLSDGTILGIHQSQCEGWRNLNPDGSKNADSYYDVVCGLIFIDLNGVVLPNKNNKDFFIVRIDRKKVTPYGSAWGGNKLDEHLTNLR